MVLQTSIVTDGFRSLAEGEAVEFTIEHGDDGRTKAVQVTGPAGAPPQVRPARFFRSAVSGGWFRANIEQDRHTVLKDSLLSGQCGCVVLLHRTVSPGKSSQG